MIANNTKKILSENEFLPKKKFGQNFLNDNNVLNDIVKLSKVNKNELIIEIGPGLGGLTELLCKNAKQVLCYEIDSEVVPILKSNLKDFDNYEIILNDFLKRDIEKDILDKFGDVDNVRVIANIPYNITTPIILKLLECKRIKSFFLMVQKELAQRFSAEPKTKEYGSISAYLNYVGVGKLERIVSKNCFTPAPDVDSALFSFVKEKDADDDVLSYLRDAFSQKRKTIVNNLNSSRKTPKDMIKDILNELNIKEDIRAEALSIDELIRIKEKLYEN